MDLLKLRPAYQRAGTDDVEQLATPPPNYELSDYHSIRSFAASKPEPSAQHYGSEYHLIGDPVTQTSPVLNKSKWVMRFEGWRTGASTAAVFALLSMCINFGVAIWLGSLGKNAAIVEVYSGNCDTVTRADIWVHLAINILSTVLLGGSNFCSISCPHPIVCGLTDDI
jgi:hypothetical protein